MFVVSTKERKPLANLYRWSGIVWSHDSVFSVTGRQVPQSLCINSLSWYGINCFKMSLTLKELLDQNIINNVNLKLGHMEVLLNKTSGDEITYLYKLKDGKASSSFGIK